MSRSLSYATPKPAGGIELWSWLFMRLSGLLLLLLALGHLVIMHLINNVDAIDYNFVAGRYAGWFWRAYDGTLLLLAMIHGLNGVRILLDDYLAHWRGHRWLIRALYGLGAVFLLIGLYVVLFFKPALR
ncbi:MAG: succinate dehydrogenase [Candidatus Omnitrophica bacterium]|nr:succinate dehydrogenase [Candidatus Omnitrophota bacterium]